MKLGLFGLNFGPPARGVAELARTAEELGYDSLWFGDHVVLPSPQSGASPLPPDSEILEPIVTFAAAAAVTDTIELGTGIVILPQRHPVLLAKQVATLDALSGGRFTLGVGAGYLQPELEALGAGRADRGKRTDEYLAVMRDLWQNDPAHFDGEFVSYSNVAAYPQPRSGLRVVIGGHSGAAHRRAVRSGHGWYGWFLRAEEADTHVAALREVREQEDRPGWLGDLEIVVTPRGRVDRGDLEAFEAAGVDHIVLLVDGRLSGEERVDFMTRNAPSQMLP